MHTSTGKPIVPPEGALANTRVLVTRPVRQADTLARLIASHGGEAVCFPTIEILEPSDHTAVSVLLDRLHEFHIAIFISANAVDRGMSMIESRRATLPRHLQVACVGRSSANELRRFGVMEPIMPARRFDSEGLLALPQLTHVQDKNIVIFRGEGGRALLAETLDGRGAHVAYAECYRRAKPNADNTALLRRWSRGKIDIVTATSVEGLRNLFDMVGPRGRKWLIDTPIVVVSRRMTQVSAKLGFAHSCVAEQADDEAIVEAIKAWRVSQNSL